MEINKNMMGAASRILTTIYHKIEHIEKLNNTSFAGITFENDVAYLTFIDQEFKSTKYAITLIKQY